MCWSVGDVALGGRCETLFLACLAGSSENAGNDLYAAETAIC